MRNVFALAALIFISIKSISQTTVSGSIRDGKQTVNGASIAIKDSYDGATTDSAGKFRFRTTEKGEQIITVSAIGYKPFEQKIDLNGTSLQLLITLKEEISEMKAVVITAGAFEASDKKRATVLTSLDILTTASANADIPRQTVKHSGLRSVFQTQLLH